MMNRFLLVAAVALGLATTFVPAARAGGTSQAAGGQPMDDLLKAGVEEVMNGHFEEGEARFRQVVDRWPEDPAGYVLLAGAQWWLFARDPDETTYDRPLLKALEVAIARAEAADAKNPRSGRIQLYLGGAYGMRARYHVMRKEWMGAARDGKRAVDRLERAVEIDSTLYDAYLGLGMYQYYTAVLPKVVKVAQVLLMVPRGDRETGLRQMELAREKGWLADAEAQFFLIDIYLEYERRFRDALMLAQDLQRRYPDNPYFELIEGVAQVDFIGNYPQAIALLGRLGQKARQGQVLPAFASDIELRTRYYLGKAYMWKRDYPRAKDTFLQILAERPASPRWMMPWVHFRAGQAHDLLGERGKAITQYRAVLSGPEIGNLYSYARKQLKEPFTLDPAGSSPPRSGRSTG